MEIESLSRRQSSLSLDRALSVYPTSSPPPTNHRPSRLLALLALEAVWCYHDDHCATLSSTSTFTPPSRVPLCFLHLLVKLQHSASTNRPFPFSCHWLQRHRSRPPLSHPTTDPATPPCVPHLSNDLLLMLYQLTLQTASVSLFHYLFSSLELLLFLSLSYILLGISYPLRCVFSPFSPSCFPSTLPLLSLTLSLSLSRPGVCKPTSRLCALAREASWACARARVAWGWTF